VPRPSAADETRTRIVDAALALLDAEGLDALSTRRLAQDLGIRGPTLYHYFANKRALLDALMERIVDQIWDGVESALRETAPADWEATLRGYVRGALAGMAQHPNAIEHLARRPANAARTLSGYEMLLERLTTAGWSLGTAWQVFLAAENLVLSAALEASAPTFAPAVERTHALPHLRELVGLIDERPQLDFGFTVGLEALLSGLRSRADAPVTA